MTLENIKKLYSFHWGQAFSDASGKSSIVPVAGWYLTALGGVVLMIGAIQKDANVMMYGLGECTLGAGLLGYRKGVDGKAEGSFPTVTEPGQAADVIKKEVTQEISKITQKIETNGSST